MCTDNLLIQVSAIECPDYMQGGEILWGFASILIPFHIPCLNNRINNIVEPYWGYLL